MSLAVGMADRALALIGLGTPGRDAPDAAANATVPLNAREGSLSALQRGETHYTDRPGIAPLREALQRSLSQRYGISVDAKNGLVVSCGVTEARFVAIQQLLPSGNGVVVALDHPERIAGACLVRGLTLLGPDAEPSGPGILYLSGAADPAARSSWLARAQAAGWPIIFEADGDAPHPATEGYEALTVTIGGVGYEHGMEAWRVGFIAAPSETAAPLRDFKQALTICTTNLSQWGALALLEGLE